MKANEDAYIIISNLLRTIDRRIEQGRISFAYLGKFIHVLANAGQPHRNKTKRFVERYGEKPPLFILLSPTQACNLVCRGCYANCDNKDNVTMKYSTVTRILDEKRDSWGSFLTVISGGEPFLYRDGKKTIFDVFSRYPDTLFLVYTNGTQINAEVAKRLSKCGNVAVAISVEGYEKETDERRGSGTFKKIQAAFEHLRNAGVLFGITYTVTSKNVDILLNNYTTLCKYYFEHQGASFMWLFQYMPIGRDHNTFDLVITPDKRKQLFDSTWQMVYFGGYFIVDFWNSAILSSGCIAAGRPYGGFIYIDWNGNIMPCVFTPYYMDNIYDIYKSGGHLDDALQSPLMKGIRNWQNDYYYKITDPNKKGSVLTPCPLKDHFRETYRLFMDCDVKCANPEAQAALNDVHYYNRMVAYGDVSRIYFDQTWQAIIAREEKSFNAEERVGHSAST